MLQKTDSYRRGEQKGFSDCGECSQSLYDLKQRTDRSADAGKGTVTDSCNCDLDVCPFACCGTASAGIAADTQGEPRSLCCNDGFYEHWIHGIPGTGSHVRQWSASVWSGLSDSL